MVDPKSSGKGRSSENEVNSETREKNIPGATSNPRGAVQSPSGSPTPLAGWQSPPEPINQILDTPPAPAVMISPHHQWLVELDQPLLPAIAELAEPEVAVAGFRLNPKTNGPSRRFGYRGIRVRSLESATAQVLPLPDAARISFLRWSPDGQKLGFTLTWASGIELWMVDLAEGVPRRITDATLNAAYGTPYRWLSNQTFLCKFVAPERGDPPIPSPIPAGPIIQENLGRKTPSRTYTNLLQNPDDEALFEYYISSTLERVTLDGRRSRLVDTCLIDEARPSPDGRYITLTTLHRPFSYQLPASYFPTCIQILDEQGTVVRELADLPLADNLSTKFDAVRNGPRRVYWRSDRSATLTWVEALDQGDPTQEVPHRDVLFELDAPFTDQPRELWRSQNRFRRVRWGRNDVALVWEQWYDTRQQRIWRIYPDQPETPPQLLVERSFEDQYSDPGMPRQVPAPQGAHYLLRFTPDGNGLYFSGRGASPEGVYPFLDRFDLETTTTERLWQAQSPYFESVVALLDGEAHRLITHRQSQTEPPNYFFYARADGERVPITHYPDPAPQFAGIHKEIVQYRRSDGVQLSARLYLPANYDAKRDGPLPTIFWVYPAEFKDKELAGQVTIAGNTFSRPWGTSALFLLTQGYAILDDPSLPIIGEGDAEPNDTYVEQLLAGIEAAIAYVADRGVADRDRLCLGGHSYGAFTTANVLAHSNLFRAGIARSGAYNRSLTPFGFQGEQRTFWEAADTYIQMSPFTHAAKITAPLLLIHGADDSNAGTYPLQTERFYEALKGLGATVRQVMLPLEDHGYRSREAVGHVLWEMVQWCDRYVKNAGDRPL
ncbi:prolyl oligopeptidase family serine peptidase [Kovacikia minuta CCNUW1]|uniref:S9 family peptidase n=1 Tax=Kovacikia minuta TaxID=2931930 RepID=UPI001CCF69C7|nr:prolyl oligopeptidase family serine peptidase [Kovacikia minuta]UBF25544.1 prolyl oligopeptidase family serine peptidase [Kovacikia minuta CCNUW1]